MHLGMLLQMASDGMGERTAVGPRPGGITTAELALRSARPGHRPGRPGRPARGPGRPQLRGRAPGPVRGGPGQPALRARQLPAGRRPAPRPGASHGPGHRGGGRRGSPSGWDPSTGSSWSAGSSSWTCPSIPRWPRPIPTPATPTTSPCCSTPAAPPASPRPPCCAIATWPPTCCPPCEFAGAGEDEASISQRAAVPHRRCLLGAVVDLHRPPGGAHRVVRTPPVGRGGAGRGGHPRHGRAHHAQAHPRGGGRRRRRAPVAALAVLRRRPHAPGRHRAGHGRCCPTSASSTPTA